MTSRPSNNKSTAPSCDRRTSRAAIHILLTDVIPVLRSYLDDERYSGDVNDSSSSSSLPSATIDDDTVDLMQEYEPLISKFIKDSSTPKCLLSPSNFGPIYWNEELLSTSIFTRTKRFGASRSVSGRATKANSFNSVPITLYVCPYTQKSFVNRYYLDLHLQRYHADHWNKLLSTEKDDTTESMMEDNHDDQIINTYNNTSCPSEELCPILGWRLCQQTALDLEPYHGSGGNIGAEDERAQRRGVGYHHHHTTHLQSIQRSYKRTLDEYPCQEEEMEYSRNVCDFAIDSCFIEKENDSRHDSVMSQLRTDIAHDLKKLLCDRQTCHHGIFHSIAFGHHHHKSGKIATTSTTSHAKIGVHHSREIFDNHHEYISSGGYGLWFILLLFSVIYGGWFYLGSYRHGINWNQTNKKIDVRKRKKFE